MMQSIMAVLNFASADHERRAAGSPLYRCAVHINTQRSSPVASPVVGQVHQWEARKFTTANLTGRLY